MKDVLGFEGIYQVTSCGRIWSCRYNRWLKPAGGKGNYQMVMLQVNGKRVIDYVHRIVAKAYIPNPNNYPQINHKDEIKDHNWYMNLEWSDVTYNLNYGSRTEKATKKHRETVDKNKIYCPSCDRRIADYNWKKHQSWHMKQDAS